jgi:glucose/arabinose dehydrogenase
VSRIAEYRVSGDPNVAAPAETLVMSIDQPFGNHNGGQLAFGPDGYLYIGLGDGGSGNDPLNNAQNRNTLLGSLLRIDVDSGAPYSVPSDNPYVGSPGRDEIWAIGLRNPWRFSFDGDSLYIGDVGQGAREEIDVVAAGLPGLNYGWPQLEGTRCNTEASIVDCGTAGRVAPLVEYATLPGSAVTGGFVYRGSELPDLVGHYFYGDFSAGWIRSFKVVGGTATEQKDWTAELGTVPLISSFGRDSAGNLYVVSIAGDIYRLTAN